LFKTACIPSITCQRGRYSGKANLLERSGAVLSNSGQSKLAENARLNIGVEDSFEVLEGIDRRHTEGFDRSDGDSINRLERGLERWDFALEGGMRKEGE
jgi:hypothetical protein